MEQISTIDEYAPNSAVKPQKLYGLNSARPSGRTTYESRITEEYGDIYHAKIPYQSFSSISR
ncbi:MAG TPA: hypothetical protein DCF63_00770 [Planctomycetaceae bacterium]|nr:hypothetical protein [Planctomycetaceae bacterium]